MHSDNSSLLQLRQVCFVAERLEPVVENLTRILGLEVCYRDPHVERYGLENSLLAIGDNFLEVVAPIQEETAAERYLRRRGGDGGYMIITQAASRSVQESIRERALKEGVRIAHEMDRGSWVLCQLHPADMEAAFLEIDWDQEENFSGNWNPAGGIAWKRQARSDRSLQLLGAELQSPDPRALAAHWSAVTAIPLIMKDGMLTLPMNNAWLNFVPLKDDRGAGISGLFLEVADVDAVLREAEKRGCLDAQDRLSIGGVSCYLRPGVQSKSERQSS